MASPDSAFVRANEGVALQRTNRERYGFTGNQWGEGMVLQRANRKGVPIYYESIRSGLMLLFLMILWIPKFKMWLFCLFQECYFVKPLARF